MMSKFVMDKLEGLPGYTAPIVGLVLLRVGIILATGIYQIPDHFQMAQTLRTALRQYQHWRWAEIFVPCFFGAITLLIALEEIVFRSWPSMFFGNTQLVCAISSLLFALLHQVDMFEMFIPGFIFKMTWREIFVRFLRLGVHAMCGIFFWDLTTQNFMVGYLAHLLWNYRSVGAIIKLMLHE